MKDLDSIKKTAYWLADMITVGPSDEYHPFQDKYDEKMSERAEAIAKKNVEEDIAETSSDYYTQDNKTETAKSEAQHTEEQKKIEDEYAKAKEDGIDEMLSSWKF